MKIRINIMDSSAIGDERGKEACGPEGVHINISTPEKPLMNLTLWQMSSRLLINSMENEKIIFRRWILKLLQKSC